MKRDWVLELFLEACRARERDVSATAWIVPIEVGRALQDPRHKRARVRARKKRRMNATTKEQE